MITVQQAIEHADWFTRYALDRLGGDGREYDRRLVGRISCALAQLAAAVELAKPDHDQTHTRAAA